MAWMLGFWMLMLLPLVAWPATASSFSVVKPGCQARCGGVDIPYPFGIGAGCFRPGFQIACDNMTPFLPDATVEDDTRPAEPVRVLNLTVAPRAQARVLLPVAHQCFDAVGNETAGSFDGKLRVNPAGVYRISSAANELFVLGCSTFIYAGRGRRGARKRNATSYRYFSGCVAYCRSARSAWDGRCNSVGCCRVDIPPALTNTRMRFGKWLHAGVEFSPCNHAFIVERNHYVFRAADLWRTPETDQAKRWSMPLWLDWAIRNLSCPLAVKTPGYACVSKHSDCANSTNGKGYICICKEGYEGNP